MSQPPVWQMIRDAVNELGGRATYGSIIDHIHLKYPEVKESTVRAQIIVCTVNAPSRIHYPENKKPRKAESRYDFLYSVGKGSGEVVLYNPNEHGLWAIAERSGKLTVVQEGTIDQVIETPGPENEEDLEFPLESHLRDFLAKNLTTIQKDLHLYHDENKREGIEYPTATGPIDILAIDSDRNFVIFELKVTRGHDKAMGQLMRYMGWVQKNLANGKQVKGFIVAKSIDDGLKYAATTNKDVRLLEYEVKFAVKSAGLELS